MPHHSSYREQRPASELAPWVSCVWVRHAPVDAGPGRVAEPVRVTPDGCVDLMWIDGTLRIAGPDTVPRLVDMAPGTSIAGVRLRPGDAPLAVGNVPVSEIRDEQPDLADVWAGQADRLIDRLAATRTPWEATTVLEQALISRLPGYVPDQAVRMAARALDRPRPAAISALSAELGLSARQFHRRMVAAVGYTPKTLHAILRFRRLRAACMDRAGVRWADLAAELGYADQAHLARETRRWSGLTPTAISRSPVHGDDPRT
jgi:AraC-like DNA-binding protein